MPIERGPRGYDYLFEDGHWLHLKKGQIWRNACCGCALVHDITFDLKPHGRGHKLLIKVERNETETKLLRKAKRAKRK